MTDPDVAKRAAAYAAADLVQDGMTIGLGSGSTFSFVLDRLAERMRDEGLQLRGVPTSAQTAAAAERAGVDIRFIHLNRSAAASVASISRRGRR